MITEKEQRGILAGRTRVLVRPAGRLGLGLGQAIRIHEQVTIRIAKIRPKGRDRCLVYFAVEDHRPRLLARDSTHGYTASSAHAVNEEPEAVPEHYQELLSREAGAANAIAATKQRIREQVLAAERRMRHGSSRGRRARLRQATSAAQALAAHENAA